MIHVVAGRACTKQWGRLDRAKAGEPWCRARRPQCAACSPHPRLRRIVDQPSRADRDREVRPVGALLERDLARGAVTGEVDLGVVLFLLLVRHRVAVLAVERLFPRVVGLIEVSVHVARDLGGRAFLLLAREGDPARRGELGRELRRAGHRRRCRATVRRFLVLVRVPTAAPGDGERRGRDDEDRCKGAPAHGTEAYKCAHRIAPPTSATAPSTATRTIVRVSPPPEDRPAAAATGDPSTVR